MEAAGCRGALEQIRDRRHDFNMGNIEVYCVIIKHYFLWLRPTFIPGAAQFDVDFFVWIWLILAAYL